MPPLKTSFNLKPARCFGMSMHHSLLKCVILFTAFHNLPILPKELGPIFGKGEIE
jgi:hypothetical protein